MAAIDPAGATAATATSAQAAQRQLAGNYDSFLQLLTAQLRYQDPTAPVDATQFVTQLSQLSQVEQTITTNQRLEELIAVARGSALTAEAGLLGKAIEATGQSARLPGDGPVTLHYELAAAAQEGSVAIRDANGAVVRTLPLDLGAGPHELAWDGRDATGSPLPAGLYQLDYSAAGRDGQAVTVAGIVTGKVARIEADSAGAALVLESGERVPATALRAVVAAAS